MKITNRIWTGILSAFAMVLLILDAQTALKGAKEGVTICLYTVIPSLFPFIILSCLISSAATGLNIWFLRPLGKLCGMPAGSESLLLLGLVGGYPIGAQGVYQAYQNKTIDHDDARRMLGFCNNAGPAFIFGMMSGMFPKKAFVLLLWAVHFTSALIVGTILPNRSKKTCYLTNNNSISFVSAVENSIKSMACICGWVMIFRVFISFLTRWILWILPAPIYTLIVGVLELSNGCISLYHINPLGLRFIIASILLSFGGVCVIMQTKSVTKELGIGTYFPGKLMQCMISVALSSILQTWIFAAEDVIKLPVVFYIGISLMFTSLLVAIYYKNNSRNLAINVV